MKSRWIDYQGKRILYIDLSDFGYDTQDLEAELAATVSTIGQEIYKQPLHSVLVLVDIRNTVMNQKTNTLMSERITATREYILRTAVVGMTGIRKVFLDYFARLAGSKTGSFDDPEAAKRWLVAAK